jgi:hypothetical protein
MARILQQALTRAANYLYGPFGKDFAVLGANLDDHDEMVTLAETAATVTGGPTLRRGHVLNVGVEAMLVRSYDPNVAEAQVLRGYLGTDPTVHSIGDLVDVNPRFPEGVMWLDLLDELAGLPETIYRVVLLELDTVQGERVMPLPVDFDGMYGVLSVRSATHGIGDHQRFASVDYQLRPTDAGNVLVLADYPATAGKMSVLAKLPIATDGATLDTPLSVLGLNDSMLDVLAMGVALRRLSWAEAQRSNRQAQGEPRIPTESPPMHALQSSQALRQVYDRRLAQEGVKLWAYHKVKW